MSTLPTRILMTADAVGGVWTYALELARGVGEAGVEVCLATMGPRPTPEQREAASQIPNLRVFESDYKLEWMQEPWQEVDAAAEWLLALEDRLQPDLVQLNGYVHGNLGWNAPVVVAAHSCVLSWWRAVKGEAVPGEWDEYRRRVGRGLHAADMVVAPTTAMLEAVERHYGELDRTRVIYNGRDSRDFAPGAKKELIFAAGRLWDEAKNVAAIERIASELSWPVLIAGDAAEPDVARGGAAPFSGAKFLGKLDQQSMRRHLGQAAIFAAPAKYEPFGLCALEAALSGCALVLGDIPSQRELWDGVALFVDPDDSAGLSEALELLSKNSWMRNELAWRARERAQRYSTTRMTESYLDLYRSVNTIITPSAMAEVRVCA